jgi:hypothetical protein
MSHWAELDKDNKVIRVTVGDNNDPNGDEGYQWLIDNLGGKWVKTSYNGTIRKHFAGVGFSFDESRDAFIPPQPFNSWLLEEENLIWVAPKPYPTAKKGESYSWNEETLDWDLVV